MNRLNTNTFQIMVYKILYIKFTIFPCFKFKLMVIYRFNKKNKTKWYIFILMIRKWFHIEKMIKNFIGSSNLETKKIIKIDARNKNYEKK